ncbi:MAG: serine/threonine protein kinase [Lentisphaeraceae bacterium]|nr:serine/threonine protein kinase [Lentisphaeraceae bacterium]
MFQSRFVQEGTLAATINQQNIVRVFDAGNDEGKFYLVMELVEGDDYEKVFKKNEKPLSVDAVLEMLLAVCDALSTAHKSGIVHRDIKPENIMKTVAGDIKLADLGIAKFENSQDQNTIEGSTLGTPYYISPEQAVDASKVDSRTDIYSLGATAYYLLTGTHPFTAETAINMILKHIHELLENPVSRNSAIPTELSAIICKMMAKEKNDRYQSV